MAEQNITIEIDRRELQRLYEGGFRICFGSCIGNGNPNIVAWSDNARPCIQISFQSKYSIAATDSPFRNGMGVNVNNRPQPINFREIYTLPGDWTDGTISSDKSLGNETFRFKNDTSRRAAAVVFQHVHGRETPVYVSSNEVPPHGTEDLTPKDEIAVWVDNRAETGSMVSPNNVSRFNVSGKSDLKLKYNGSGFNQTN